MRFAGFRNDQDEWVSVRRGLRERSIPLDHSECDKVEVGDLVLCFRVNFHIYPLPLLHISCILYYMVSKLLQLTASCWFKDFCSLRNRNTKIDKQRLDPLDTNVIFSRKTTIMLYTAMHTLLTSKEENMILQDAGASLLFGMTTITLR